MMCNDCIKLSNILATDEIILEKLAANNNSFSKPKDLFHLSRDEFISTVAVEERMNYAKSNVFYNYLTDVLLFGVDGMVYCSNDVSDHFAVKQFYAGQYANADWFPTIANRESYLLWDTSFQYNNVSLVNSDKDHFISVQRVIYDKYVKNAIGVLFVNMSKNNLTAFLDHFGGDAVLLLNERDEPIYQSGELHILSEMKWTDEDTYALAGDLRYHINKYELNKFGWKLLAFTDENRLTAEVSALKKRTFSTSVLMLMAVTGVNLWLIMYMTNPIKHLRTRILQMNIGKHNPSDMTQTSKESSSIIKSDVSDLITTVECLAERVEVLVKRVLEEQALKADLHYEALRAQINPHFLFNTLNTIRWSAMISGNKTTGKMITELGKLMEASMNKGSEEIPLQQEMELVRAYVNIQNMRFSNVITLTVHLPEELKNYQIIKLLLQPIVENSIKHGLKFEPGWIDVNVFALDDALIIDVTDSGMGFPDAVSDAAGSDLPLSGIGLKNVTERIRLRYGPTYGLKIAPEDRKAHVRLILPLLPANNQKEVSESHA
jgi:sensor histidine kinase YesM